MRTRVRFPPPPPIQSFKTFQENLKTNKILFINAQDIFIPIDRVHNTWTDEQIAEIASIVRRYRGEDGYGKYDNIKRRCKDVTLEEIKASHYSLNPGRYIEIVENEIDDVGFGKRMKELMSEFRTLTDEAHRLENKIILDWYKVCNLVKRNWSLV